MAKLESEIRMQKARNKMLKEKGEAPKVYNLLKPENSYDEPPKGNPTGICKTCGKEFEQNYSSDRNVYSSFKTCPGCRRKAAERKEKKLTEEQREISIASIPYEPFPAQQEIHDAFETHRFVVIDAGNRFGKDRCSIMACIKYFVECLNENRLIDAPNMVPAVLWWIVAPTEKMAKQNWRELKQYFPKEWIVARSDSNYQMETIGGGIIEVRSGYSPEDLVGVGLDLILITEGARFADLEAAWANLEARLNSPGRGRKKDRAGQDYGQGKAIINSSPLGKNYFYTMWCWGQKGHDTYDSNWWSCQFPWTANPTNAELALEMGKTKYGEKTYEERLRLRLGDRLYRQNYLGDFLAGDGSVFKQFEENCVVNIYAKENCSNAEERKEFVKNWEQVIPGRIYVAGYDPATGSSGDSPWFVIRDTETNNVVKNYDLYGKRYERQIEFIVERCKEYNYATLYWLRTGHTAVESLLADKEIEAIPIDEQGGHKAELVQTLELAVENGDIHVLADGSPESQTLIFQMNDYTEKKTQRGNSQYSNNQEAHDDAVSALYAAWSTYKVADVPIEYCSMMGGVMRVEDFE